MTPIAEMLRTKLSAAGTPAKEIARRAGISAGFLSSLSRGRKTPSPAAVAALGQALGLSPVEQQELQRTAKCSQRLLTIPTGASPAAFVLLHDMIERVASLTDRQIDIIARVVALRVRHDERCSHPSSAAK